MTELLAPAGSFEALVAAISNGADAIYLGLNRFGARAYANNFTLEDLEKSIEYAHLRNVKIYVTMNTIVYDSELEDAYKQLDEIYILGVDGVIVQDLSIFNYIVKNCPQMEAHCSTQMGIDDLEGTLLFKSIGAKRVVLSREVPIDKIKEIKKIAKLPIEIFVHGALCVSYSGNCLMSGLIGYRSGNRGRCVGSCRKPYKVINKTTTELISTSYILSMKDLNTIDYIDQLRVADSIKIEGRMKESVYVANVVSNYRKALEKLPYSSDDLKKTFNRTFTKGYIFKEDKKNICNIVKPNNFGYPIGVISKKTKIGYEIKLHDQLNQQDIIRIDHNGVDVNLSVSKLYDSKEDLISTSSTVCYIKIKEELSIGDIVYKTKDFKFTAGLEKTYPKEFRRIDLNLYVYATVGSKMSMTLEADGQSVTVESDFILEKALKSSTTEDQFIRQFNRLNDTVYQLNHVEFYSEDCFIPATKINELRRSAIELLNQQRTTRRNPVVRCEEEYNPLGITKENQKLSVYCTTQEQYQAAIDLGIKKDYIYYKDNIVRRNETKYPIKDTSLLIGGYGGIYAYRKTNPFVTDYSLNVVNYPSVYTLFSLGAKRVTLSYEINQQQIKDLISNYKEHTCEIPNLEMIVYGRAPMMFTHYCPLKALNQCGKCKENEYVLEDEYGDFPILSHEDCTTTILNGKVLNLIDDLDSLNDIAVLRIQLTKENYEESKDIIAMFQDKLNTMTPTRLFNKQTDTRGHFNKEIL